MADKGKEKPKSDPEARGGRRGRVEKGACRSGRCDRRGRDGAGGQLVFVLGLGGAKESKAEEAHELVHDDSEQRSRRFPSLEDEMYQNMQTGQVWVWGLSVYAQVKKKNVEFVQGRAEQRSAEIREGMSQIVGRARVAVEEPDRQTLNRRQFTAWQKIVKPSGTASRGSSAC